MALRTVVDGRQRNDNTIKDVTPLPDQDLIRLDVARARIRSKIDLSDAYEQIRIIPSDVPKTAFATIYGTFASNVMQQGDCNAPSTFQRSMNTIFHDYIGIFMHSYLDDLFVYVTSVTPRRIPTDSGRDSAPLAQPSSIFHFHPISNTHSILPQSLIHHLPLLLPDPRSLAAASAAELLPSINT